MEIKLQLRLQSILNFIHYVENMELETWMLIFVFILMTPFIIHSLWSLGMALMWQLFWLGVYGGAILFTLCFAYLIIIKFTNWGKLVTFWSHEKRPMKTNCTLLDLVLSVYFQSGMWIPSVIWTPLMEIFDGNLGEKLRTLPRSEIGERQYPPPAAIPKFLQQSQDFFSEDESDGGDLDFEIVPDEGVGSYKHSEARKATNGKKMKRSRTEETAHKQVTDRPTPEIIEDLVTSRIKTRSNARRRQSRRHKNN